MIRKLAMQLSVLLVTVDTASAADPQPTRKGELPLTVRVADYDRTYIRGSAAIHLGKGAPSTSELARAIVEVVRVRKCGSDAGVPFLVSYVRFNSGDAGIDCADLSVCRDFDIKLFEPDPMGSTPGKVGPECIRIDFELYNLSSGKRHVLAKFQTDEVIGSPKKQ